MNGVKSNASFSSCCGDKFAANFVDRVSAVSYDSCSLGLGQSSKSFVLQSSIYGDPSRDDDVYL